MHWLGFFDFLELKTYDYRFNNVRGPLTGWRASDSTIINLGTDVHPEKFSETAEAEKADLGGLSALGATTVSYQQVTMEEFQKAGLRDKVHILVGGAPTTQDWADQCGADGWGVDAVQAVRLALELVKKPREAWA